MTEFLLAIELDGTGVHPASWRRADSRAEDLFTGGYWVDAIATAEKAGIDAVFLPDSFAPQPGGHEVTRGVLDAVAIAARVAAATHRIGLLPQAPVTHTEPFHLAKAIQSLDFAGLGRASLDHLSGGRAAWNVVTSSDAFTGENFRRGGYLEHSLRYRRAAEVVEATRALWDSWPTDSLVVDRTAGVFAREIPETRYRNTQFDIAGRFPLPPSPQGHPVLLQAGDSDDGREFGAATADAIFTGHGSLEAGQRFYADIKGRLAKYGRTPEELKILPAATFVLGDTATEAEERARHIRRQQVGPQTAIAFLEQVWGRDLSDYDPDGPLPDIEPEADVTITRGRVRHAKDPRAVAEEWRARAEADKLSIRELIIEVTARQQFVGTPTAVAEQIDTYVQADASDGFILVPHLTPGGLDEFVDRVIPELQERGSFRTEYTGTTLRDHLGLRHPHRNRILEGASAS
ncbi:NtaA/DmoA family FMN-dependent monooxygenase [Nocardia sp. CA-119907]|uniref:NtaA/DmoA family FMN-dependent monooxygenase n=1 Tax=Nocardia sp. CA-119907 TaxID=3239973 RepID=UPI003D97FE02